jgi:hypothetical protein
MDKFEKLVQQIIKEATKDGEPVTREEAEEMAKMELGAKQIKRYERSDKPKEKPKKVRKVDEEKKVILNNIKEAVELMGITITEVKTETELSFLHNDNSYTIKLIKHTKKKK